ncbi:MAG TPA: hypothetical protein VI636_23915 [Candidatus Angelobacter sp.]
MSIMSQMVSIRRGGSGKALKSGREVEAAAKASTAADKVIRQCETGKNI